MMELSYPNSAVMLMEPDGEERGTSERVRVLVIDDQAEIQGWIYRPFRLKELRSLVRDLLEARI